MARKVGRVKPIARILWTMFSIAAFLAFMAICGVLSWLTQDRDFEKAMSEFYDPEI